MKFHTRKELAASIVSPERMVLKFGKADRQVDVEKRTVTFIFSDGSQDRMGDTIDPAGWDLKAFKMNGVCLWAHNQRALPIGKVVSVKVKDGQLIGVIQFCTEEEYDFADTVFKLIVGGYLNAVSVGFQPKEYEVKRDKEGNYIGYHFTKQALMEISVVPVPALPTALVQAKSAGFKSADISDIEDDCKRFVETMPMEGFVADEPAIVVERQPATIIEQDGKKLAYDIDGDFMGAIKDGRLSVTKAYASKLAANNIKMIDAQEAAAKPAPAPQFNAEARAAASALSKSLRQQLETLH